MSKKIFMKISYVETFYEDFMEITSFPCQIGRDPGSRIALMGHDISRKHAEIVEEDGKFLMKDLGSRSGIWHKGESLKSIEIEEGTQLRLGAAILNFSFVDFPLEQTISHAHMEERIHHEPVLKRIEETLDAKMSVILFLILLTLSYFTAPDISRKSDYVKNLLSSLAYSSFVAPLMLALIIIVFRKVNRGEYSWTRSLCMAYFLCISGQLLGLLENSFCWFNFFSLLWNSIVVNILMIAIFLFWWLFAVGKDSTLKARSLRALIMASVSYVFVLGIDLLATGYRSDYQIETCDSLTGWHKGDGEALSSLQDFVTESAKELSK